MTDLESAQEELRALVAHVQQLIATGTADPATIAQLAAQLQTLQERARHLLTSSTAPLLPDEEDPLLISFPLEALHQVQLAASLPIAIRHALPEHPFSLALRGLSFVPLAPWVSFFIERLRATPPDVDISLSSFEMLTIEQGMHVVALAAVHGMFELLGWDAPNQPLLRDDGTPRHELAFALARVFSEGNTKYFGADHQSRQQAAREIEAFVAALAS